MVAQAQQQTQTQTVTGAPAAEWEWRKAIRDLDTALVDQAIAAGQRQAVAAGLAVLEAHAIQAAEGRNEAQRAAAVVLVLADNAQAKRYRADEAIAETRLADAQRRERIAVERCRLARAVMALHAAGGREDSDA